MESSLGLRMVYLKVALRGDPEGLDDGTLRVPKKAHLKENLKFLGKGSPRKEKEEWDTLGPTEGRLAGWEPGIVNGRPDGRPDGRPEGLYEGWYDGLLEGELYRPAEGLLLGTSEGF